MAFSQKNDPSVFGMILDTHLGGTTSAMAHALPENDADPWRMSEEGQLAVDVLETDQEVVVISTMAGAVTDKIELYLRHDLLTIRGFRKDPIEPDKVVQVFHQECFWGSFSRTVVLPIDVKADLASAEYGNGILMIRIPKRESRERAIPIRIVEE